MTTSLNPSKKAADPSLKDCANCGTIGAKLTCAKCKATHYCSKACQKQHWRNSHKAVCFTPEERRPRAMSSGVNKNDGRPVCSAELGGSPGECPICLESVLGGTLCTLPCKHEFHKDCVEELRKQGVQQVCPLCRTALPAGPEQLFVDATSLYVGISARHNRTGFPVGQLYVINTEQKSWTPPTASEVKLMSDVVEMLRNAANQGHMYAQHNLGAFYEYGSGVVRDQSEAARWFRKAADQGNDRAQLMIGLMYTSGDIVAQDHEEAARWFRKAADQGHAEAQYNLGTMYREGKGVTQDYKETAHWIRKASDQGDARAQFTLGLMYYQGLGVAQDHKESVRWTHKAADQRCAEAQYYLGEMHFLGANGYPKDLKKANFYLSASEAQGNERARELRKELHIALQHTSNDSSNLNAPLASQCTCCGRCVGNNVKLKPCPRCKGPQYCGKDCQLAHWKEGHKELCNQNN